MNSTLKQCDMVIMQLAC